MRSGRRSVGSRLGDFLGFPCSCLSPRERSRPPVAWLLLGSSAAAVHVCQRDSGGTKAESAKSPREVRETAVWAGKHRAPIWAGQRPFLGSPRRSQDRVGRIEFNQPQGPVWACDLRVWPQLTPSVRVESRTGLRAAGPLRACGLRSWANGVRTYSGLQASLGSQRVTGLVSVAATIHPDGKTVLDTLGLNITGLGADVSRPEPGLSRLTMPLA